MALRIAVSGLLHETNTFAPGLTLLEHFNNERSVTNEEFERRYLHTRTSMGGVIDAAVQHGAELKVGLYTSTTPSGMIEAETADKLIDDLLRTLPQEIDGLVLIMHGAMVSEQYPDFEGECLRRLRAKVGDRFPIAMTLDLHANVSEDMTRLADIIVGYDTYPHVDMYERAVEAFGLLADTIGGQVTPTRSSKHTGMLIVPQAMMTEEGSMKLIMERAFKLEEDPRVLNVTVIGGFPYSDVADAGMTFIVTTNNDQRLADQLAAELARMAVDRKESFAIEQLPPKEAVAAALAEQEGPVILVEGSDNVGGGAPADATFVLEQLVSVQESALIVIRDVEAVNEAFRLGVGASFTGQIGGKSDRLHGKPVEVSGKIRLLFDGKYRHLGAYMTGHMADMGQTAVVESGNLTIVLTEKRVAPWDIGHIKYAGIVAEQYKIIVAKSAIAWQTAFGSIAKKTIYVDSPGCCSANLHHFEYKHLNRPLYPFDEVPSHVRV